MTVITSRQNPKIKWIKSLTTHRQERDKSNTFVVEGVRLIEEAYNSGFFPELIIYSQNLSSRGSHLVDKYKGKSQEVYEVSQDVLKSISDTENSQGLLAVFQKEQHPIPSNADFILVADGIHDPGNLGTILRTAHAAGTQAVILTPGSVDVFSPKVLRAGMGAHFYLPIHILDWDQIIARFNPISGQSMNYFLTTSDNGKVYWKPDFKKPTAIIIGSEADGASIWAHQIANEYLTIPISKNTESLNAAIAAGIILFEVVRQRSV